MGITRDFRVSVLIKRIYRPKSVCFNEHICEFNELSHEGSKGDFWRFTCFDHGLIFGLEVWIEPHGDKSWHVEGVSHNFSATLNE